MQIQTGVRTLRGEVCASAADAGYIVTRRIPFGDGVAGRRGVGCSHRRVTRQRDSVLRRPSAADRAALAAAAGEYVVESGTALTKEGDFGHGFFAIEEGEADVLKDGGVVATLGPGDVFGEIAIVASGRRTASVVAKTPMRLITLFKNDLWRIEKQSPALAEALREMTLERLSHQQAAGGAAPSSSA